MHFTHFLKTKLIAVVSVIPKSTYLVLRIDFYMDVSLISIPGHIPNLITWLHVFTKNRFTL